MWFMQPIGYNVRCRNEPEVDKSDDDSDHDLNDIDQPEEVVTISRRSHNMSTCGSRLGNIVCG